MSLQALEVLRQMSAHPQGENSGAIPFRVANELMRGGMISYARTTRWSKLYVYRISQKGREVVGAS